VTCLSKPTTLHLSPRRLAQINAIADALGVTATEAIAHMIRKEIAAGVIPAGVPGFVVKADQSGVTVCIDNGEPAVYGSEAARNLIASMRGVVAGEASIFSVKDHFSFVRVGRGFKLRAPLSGPEVSMTGDLALDLADQIEQAAA
jgi:hypothetical protein